MKGNNFFSEFRTLFAISVLVTIMILQTKSVSAAGKNNITQNAKSGENIIADSNFIYLFTLGGQYVKVQPKDGSVVSKAEPLPLSSISHLVPPYPLKGSLTAHNYWVPYGFRYDKSSGRLYGIFPKTIESDKTTAYQIIVLQLPTMDVVGTIPFPKDLPDLPRILISSDGQKLVVRYRDPLVEKNASNKIIASIIDIYDTATLKKVETIRESTDKDAYSMARTLMHTYFSNDAYFSQDGKTIYDKEFRFYRINLIDGKMVKEYIDPLQVLTEKQKEKLRSFEYMNPVTKKATMNIGISDSAAGWILVRISDQARTRKSMFTLDLETQEMSPVTDLPGDAITYLSPDGKRIIAEEIEMKKESISGKEETKAYRTGKKRIYDAVNGKKIKDFSKKEHLAGYQSSSDKNLCMTPDGKYMFVSKQNELYFVNLDADTSPVKLNVGFDVRDGILCVVADR